MKGAILLLIHIYLDLILVDGECDAHYYYKCNLFGFPVEVFSAIGL